MKGNGLSSTHRALLKKVNRQAANFTSYQQSYLLAKERQKSLRMQAEKAELARRERELKQQSEAAAAESAGTPPQA